jgi:hypothetical protein
MNPVCKELPCQNLKSGKSDYFDPAVFDSKSEAWEFFTPD